MGVRVRVRVGVSLVEISEVQKRPDEVRVGVLMVKGAGAWG